MPSWKLAPNGWRLAKEREAKDRNRKASARASLPREVAAHAPTCDCCPDCGGQLRHFGDDVSEQLEYVPENFKVIRHVRPKFTCRGCDRVVRSLSAPSRHLIERGLAGPSLLAHVMVVSKFA